MVKKNVFTGLFLIGFLLQSPAQDGYRQASAQEVTEMKEKITAASSGMKTLRCDFEQLKTLSVLMDEMVSGGFMLYRQPDRLHWEYTYPFRYIFAMNNDKVTIGDDRNKNVVDIHSSSLFREISRIIVSGINGKDIFDDTRFSVKYMSGAAGYLVILVPKQKEIKQIFHEIFLFFDVKDHTVNVVEMREAGGDRTIIRMKNKRINTGIEDAAFDMP